MEKRIVFTNPDGSIGVIVPSPKTNISPEEIAQSTVPNGATFEIVDVSVIPSDRIYRNAWKLEGGMVKHDMPKARELHKEKLRELRAPKLSQLDAEYQIADEAGDAQKKKEIAAKKKKLRDVTDHASIEAAKNVEELKLAGMSDLA